MPGYPAAVDLVLIEESSRESLWSGIQDFVRSRVLGVAGSQFNSSGIDEARTAPATRKQAGVVLDEDSLSLVTVLYK